MGDPMTTPTDAIASEADQQQLQDAAKRHLWMHFTRMSSYQRPRRAGDRAGRGPLGLGQPGPALPRRPVGPVRGAGRPRPPGAGRGRGPPGRPAGLLPAVELRPSQRHRAVRATGRPWRPARSTGSSSPPAGARRWSRPGSWPASTSGRPASPAATRCSRATSPTTAPPWAPCRSPGCRRSRSRSSRSCPGRSGWPTPTSTGRPSTATTSRRSGGGRPTTSSGTSRWKDPSRWRPCSSSRCRTRAAASRRLRATSSGSGRSATATACCSCPTRSSAPSAGWAPGSDPSATATSRT